ncbi:c-type cytochrome [Polaromonas naphthalenivorans]|uniref:Cytochrome c, class I n=1 Tax=Polaromonas naphthalenivorans (strain CJ2) TaxID=365044 RepID=A1VLR9_POLNA|nr:cytochrome c [Polaromonas naphthalenivorans]ABM36597.1 cytochrome c, class I [Polaromonas naphthalenivorans CJ2]
MKTGFRVALGMGLLAACAAGVIWALNVRDEVDVKITAAFAPSDSLIARGRYLTLAGNCMACHTARGGEPYAGGLGLATPFGTVFTSNLTPDANTGIGSWSSAHFWRALHNGRSKNGRLLYPAFPYTSYTQVTREDSDAMFAFLRSLPAVKQANRPHALRFPFNSQAALAIWRALYFTPGVYQLDAGRNAEWNRGAYLVGGLGHCSACHSPRDALGGIRDSLTLAGGLIPMQNWYAPSLASPHEAGVSHWDREQIVGLLKNGVAPGASASGPMAEVVLRSTQYLTHEDLGAMAQYLKALPGPAPEAPAAPRQASASFNTAKAAKLYEQHCAQCHGDKGEGVPGAYPPLAGNRAVTMAATDNLVQMVLGGGFAPATAGNPRPFGMPPFVLVLDDSEVADVISHVRTAWGNQAGAVTPREVNRIRANQGH